MGSSAVADFAAFFARAAILLVALVGISLSFIIVAMIIGRLGVGPLIIPAAAGVLILLYGLSVTIHEIGHAAAARLVGWRVHVIAVGPIAYLPYRRQFVRTKPAERKHRRGWVVSTPPIGPDWDKGRTAVYLGGVTANLICAVICFVPLMTFSFPVTPYGFIYTIGVISITMAVGNLIPARRNDGALLLSIAMGKRTSQADADNAWMAGCALDGLDRSAWDADLLRRLRASAASDSQGEGSDLALLGRYLVLGDVVRAHALLEHSALACNGENPELVFTRAFLIALVEHDSDKAWRLLNNVSDEARGRSHNYWRARMTIHGLRNETEDARAAAKEVRRFARKEGAMLDNDELALLHACESGAPLPSGFDQAIA